MRDDIREVGWRLFTGCLVGLVTLFVCGCEGAGNRNDRQVAPPTTAALSTPTANATIP